MIKDKKNIIDRIFPTKKCNCCKKEFIVTDLKQYMYKLYVNNKPLWYCSYTCYRKAGGDSGKVTSHYVRRNQYM